MVARRSLWPALVAAVALLVVPANATADGAGTRTGESAGKKGVSVNNVAGVDRALGDVGASWFYDWAADPQGITPPDGIEFVPMIWGAGSVNQEELDKAKASGSTLLAFNEPDMTGQANMPVEQALDLWPKLQATEMRLGAPAVATGADLEGGWLDRFMRGAAERGYRVDFIPLHWYGSDFSPEATEHLRSYLQAVHDRYQKPIWLTEYALIDFTGGPPRYPSQEQQIEFIRSSTAMLNGLPFVERYAWFTLSTEVAPTGLYEDGQPNASGIAYRDVLLWQRQ